MLIRSPGAERVLIDSWCIGPRLVSVQIKPNRGLSVLDSNAAPLHLEWECELRRGSTDIFDCFQHSREAGATGNLKRWRSGPGTFVCVTAAKLFAVGGSGSWFVEVESAYLPSAHETTQAFGLQRLVDTRHNPDHLWIPVGHTYLRCIAGFFNVGGTTVPPNEPVSTLTAEMLGWEAQGIIESYVEV